MNKVCHLGFTFRILTEWLKLLLQIYIEKPVSYYSDTAIDQRKICWLERDLNSHLRVSRLPLYPLSYWVNSWYRVLSNLSARNIFVTRLSKMKSEMCCAVLCCAVLCCAVLCCAVLCCAVLCCAVLCCAVLCCAVLCCAVLCCAVLCCAVDESNHGSNIQGFSKTLKIIHQEM